MSDHAQNLRQAAEEIRREGHAGWGNACEWAADEIERLTAVAQDAAIFVEAYRARIKTLTAERDALRRKLAELGESYSG